MSAIVREASESVTRTESANLKKFAVVVEKAIRTCKIANRNPMRDHLSESVVGNPHVQMKCRRLDRERRWPPRIEVECDGMIRRWADGRCSAGETRQRSAVDVSGGHQPRAPMPPHR